MKLRLQTKGRLLAVILGLVSIFSSENMMLFAETQESPPKPPATGNPTNPGTAGTRGDQNSCTQDNSKTIPPTTIWFLPQNVIDSKPRNLRYREWISNQQLYPETMNITSQELPNLWFFIPYQSETGRKARLILKDQNRRPVLNQEITLPEKRQGLIGIPLLPTDKLPRLEPGKAYSFSFSILCGSRQQPDSNPTFYGWIKRQELPFLNNLEAQPLSEALEIYFSNGILQDALTRLAEYRQQNPDSSQFQTPWEMLFQVTNFDDIPSHEIEVIDCCKPTTP